MELYSIPYQIGIACRMISDIFLYFAILVSEILRVNCLCFFNVFIVCPIIIQKEINIIIIHLETGKLILYNSGLTGKKLQKLSKDLVVVVVEAGVISTTRRAVRIRVGRVVRVRIVTTTTTTRGSIRIRIGVGGSVRVRVGVGGSVRIRVGRTIRVRVGVGRSGRTRVGRSVRIRVGIAVSVT